MPYRHATVLRSYELKTVRTIYYVTAAMAGLSLLMICVLFWALADGYTSARLIVLPIVLIGATIAYALSIKNHVVFSGKGELRIYARHIEIPRAFHRKPFVFELEGLEVGVNRYEGRFVFQTVSAVEVLRFQRGSERRALSSRMFGGLEALRHAAQDIVTLREGGPLPDRTLDPADAAERDDYDDALDKELEKLEHD